jgi:hypothetical protein
MADLAATELWRYVSLIEASGRAIASVPEAELKARGFSTNINESSKQSIWTLRDRPRIKRSRKDFVV